MPTRTHLVLVPGFGGFDMLGQLRYYAGVTPRFNAWKSARGGDAARAVLHYFDNLPTAAVATRGRRLRDYLLKRLLRGEFQRGDRLALVGHSTGGLDIRWLLGDLYDPPARGAATRVDGVEVAPELLLDLQPRAVFLSVPQRGTNVAQWVGERCVLRESGKEFLERAVTLYQLDPVRWAETLSSRILAKLADADLLLAMNDALTESDAARARRSAPDRHDRSFAVAAAREAYSQLALWARHIDDDTDAIDDLRPKAPDSATLLRERQWLRPGVVPTRSYATLGRCPFPTGRVSDGRAWSAANPLHWPELWADRTGRTSDLAYRLCYRACAGGQFDVDPAACEATPIDGGAPRAIARWENDGIVNTASMLWPDGAATRLVDSDHGDIIGHYARAPLPSVEGTGGPARAFDAYDLLLSDSDFGPERFRQVWEEVFDFCVA
ncbi:MAG: hypothetical protein Q8S73_36155 [Deltaproteobacteria bacterium]|nr:hypothetical protein [Myxococcales bacterium]MDP3219592.1 hypothetical protein [Deltaproteobacteria bacterium]